MVEILPEQVQAHESFVETIRLVLEELELEVSGEPLHEVLAARDIASAILHSWRVSEREETA